MLRKRLRQAEADQGLRPGLPSSDEREEIKQLKRPDLSRTCGARGGPVAVVEDPLCGGQRTLTHDELLVEREPGLECALRRTSVHNFAQASYLVGCEALT
jgi:hypothetical protein